MANKDDWGLTDQGFRRPSYTELLDSLEYKARELFGQKANLTVRSPLGIFLRIYAWIASLLFSCLEEVYNSRFIDTAVGHSLFNLGKIIGLRRLGAQKATGYLTFLGDDGVQVPEGFLTESSIGMQYVTLGEGIITNGEVTLPAEAVIAGTDSNTAKDTIKNIVNPKPGIRSVVNYTAFEGGRSTETDSEFRERYYKSVDFAGGVNIDAIISEIYSSVEAVIAVAGSENDTDEVDNNGLPPHSVELIVYGGLDDQIAKAIYRRKSAGIQTFGDIAVDVKTIAGTDCTIRFNRPKPVESWIKIYDLEVDSSFPFDGIERIKKEIIEYIGSDVTKGISVGQEVVRMTLPSVIYKVPGVLDFKIKLSPDGINYSWANIPVSYRQKAITNESMVDVS